MDSGTIRSTASDQLADDRGVQPRDLLVARASPCGRTARASPRAGSRRSSRGRSRRRCAGRAGTREADRACRCIASRSTAGVNAGSSGSGPVWASSASSSAGDHSHAAARRLLPGSLSTSSSAGLEPDHQQRRLAVLVGHVDPPGRHRVDDQRVAAGGREQQPLGPPGDVRETLAVQRRDRRIDRLHGREMRDRHRLDRLGGQPLALRAGECFDLRQFRHVCTVRRMSVTVVRGGLAESRHEVHVAVVAAGRHAGRVGRRSRPPDHAALGRQGGAGAAAARRRRARRGRLGRRDPGRVLRLACGCRHPRRDRAPRLPAGRRRPGAAAQLHAATWRPGCATTARGNHLNFLALSAARGWPLEGYRDASHPSQQAALAAIADGHRPRSVDDRHLRRRLRRARVRAVAARDRRALRAAAPSTSPARPTRCARTRELVSGEGEFDTVRHARACPAPLPRAAPRRCARSRSPSRGWASRCGSRTAPSGRSTRPRWTCSCSCWASRTSPRWRRSAGRRCSTPRTRSWASW